MFVTADGYLNFDTKINTSGFELGLKNLTGGLDKLKSGLLKIAAAVGATFSVVKITEFAKGAIESAAEINAANSQLEQTFGEMQSAAESAIERVTESSGIIKTRLNGVATSIYAFAKTSGMNSFAALNMMSEALTVAADSAAYYDRSLEEMSETLKSFLKGNYENDAALGLSCTETTRNIAANKLYGKSFIELSESQKQLVLLQMVKDANKLSGAMGQAARESEGWENVLGNLKEQWKQLLAVIGQPALKIAISVVQKITSALENLTEKIRPAVNEIMKLFGIESNETTEISGNIAESITNQNKLTEAVEETEKAQEGSLAAFDEINTISSEKSDENDEISGNSVSTPTINPVINESPVEEAVDDFAKKIQDLLIPIKKVWEKNSAELIANAEYAANSVKSLLSGIGKSISDVWENGSGEKFIGNIIRLFGDVLGIIGDVSNALKNAWDDDGRGEKLIQSYFDRWNALLDLIHVVSETFRNAWNNGTGEEICGNILEIWTNINNTVTNLRTNFAEAWSENDVGQGISQGILDIFETISEIAGNITFSVAEWAGNVDFSPFLESVDELLKSLEPFTESIGEGLEDFLNEVLLPLADWTIENLIPTFLESLSDAIDGVKSAWDTAYPVIKEKLWDKFLQPIAKFTADAATKAIELLGKAIKKIGTSITAEQVAALIDFAEGIGALILVAKGYTFLQSLSTALSGIPTVLAGLAPKIGSVITALGSAATLSLSTVFAGISAFIAGFTITTAILDWTGWDKDLEKFGEDLYDFIHEDVAQFITDWENFWSGYGEYLYDFFSGLDEDIKAVFESVGDWFNEKFQKAKDNITTIFSTIGTWFGDRWNDVKSAFSNVGDWFENKFQTAWDNITAIFKGLGAWFGNHWNDVKSALSAVADWFREKFEKAWNNITEIFSGFSDWFGEKWGNIKSVFSGTGDFFREKFQSAWDNIKSIFANPAEFFNSVWDGIKGCFSHVSTWFKDTFSEAWQTVKNVFSSGGEIFGGITEGIFETFKSVVNSLIDGINYVISVPFSAINGALDGIRGVEIAEWYPFEWLPNISIPEIPKLAQGTVVPANYGEFMAILGDNKRETEIVSPLSTIEKAVQNAMKESGGNFPEELVLNICLFPNSAVFRREIIKIVDDDRRKRGG